MSVTVVISERYLDHLLKLAVHNRSAYIVDKTLRWALKKDFPLLKKIYWIDENHFIWPTRVNTTHLISLRFLIKKESIGNDVNGDPEILITLIAVSTREEPIKENVKH